MDAKHFCCAPNCPGYPWKASEFRHPCAAGEPAVIEIAGQTVRAEVTWTPPPPPAREIPQSSHGVVIPVTVNADDWRKFVECHNDPVTVKRDPATGEISASFDAEATRPGEEPIPVRVTVAWIPPRTIFVAIGADNSGAWAIGDAAEDARAGAADRREHLRDEARVLDLDFPDASTDAAWLDGLVLVTLSGTTESLRALIKSMETGDSVAPWCPADLWDSGEVTP